MFARCKGEFLKKALNASLRPAPLIQFHLTYTGRALSGELPLLPFPGGGSRETRDVETDPPTARPG
jgi:hypothetical protein